MKKILFSLLLSAFAFPALAAPHWGSFKDNGCVHKNLRSYSSVLWDIPWGQSWELTCANTSAKVAGFRFSHPTACVKASVVDAVSITGAVLSIAGLAFPPVGVAGTVVGTSALVMDKGGAGGINMWGVFYVQDPRCK